MVGCGSESIPPAVALFGDSNQEFALSSVDGIEVPQADSVLLRVVTNTEEIAMGIPDCSGTVTARPSGGSLEVIQNGLGHSGCFIEIPAESNHNRVLDALQSEAPVELNDGKLLIRSTTGLYEFQPHN